MPGQGDTTGPGLHGRHPGYEVVNRQLPASVAGVGSAAAGTTSSFQLVKMPSGIYKMMPSKEAKESVEDNIIQETILNWNISAKPLWNRDFYRALAKKLPAPRGYHKEWDTFAQGFRDVKNALNRPRKNRYGDPYYRRKKPDNYDPFGGTFTGS